MSRVLRKGVRDEQSENKAHFFWGAVGVAASLVLLLIAAALYTIPFGERTYTAEFGSAAGVKPGDEVRIAGIAVGSVRSVELAGAHVDVEFSVRSDVFVGDASTVTVKLLTPIGGHYVMLTSHGDDELGSAPIPPERVELPYELSDAIESATPLVRDIDGSTLRETVAELDKAVSEQPQSTRAIVDNLSSLTDTLATRSDQLERGLVVSDEYVGALAADRVMLTELVRELGTLTKGFGDKRVEVVSAFDLLGRMFELFHRPVVAFEKGLEPSIVQLEEITQKLFAQLGDVDGAITTMKESSDGLAALIGGGQGPVIDQSQDTVVGVGVCIPLPGRVC
ncbi:MULTISPECIES: MlaD family protein [unclassified Rhodococcus (in: high G+C Gram-positive bacteria)]|uniref:MlaD family protein n=1 Tax=unclassified Rhodococcus (in: high G+C Gram-positive bacteria) TaxID=192944 RepID=UPI000B9B6FBA|nr:MULTISPECIES: MlaD family protein [unclassified Rhodococcus (in: high G+C Gram-positive bacteria)]OZE32990.1 mammalian cell entry protein [Rhodococcus sp. 05-2254-4]OZE44115.1 mammalian cell entry protein [Rhodococcus sp. 05-2254-3]OZE56203.1 mammalian cell entry protein [Rhodococcus sp. 05-2254-2]